jgi:hypothetical protein|tara:strand:- start:10816 stop:11031 length:216 start_codon:yes stop_codon:yes gene_type:complete
MNLDHYHPNIWRIKIDKDEAKEGCHKYLHIYDSGLDIIMGHKSSLPNAPANKNSANKDINTIEDFIIDFNI